MTLFRFGGVGVLAPPINRSGRLLFLAGVYIERSNGSSRFRWVKASTDPELTQLAYTIARRIGRFLGMGGAAGVRCREQLFDRRGHGSGADGSAVGALDHVPPSLRRNTVIGEIAALHGFAFLIKRKTFTSVRKKNSVGHWGR